MPFPFVDLTPPAQLRAAAAGILPIGPSPDGLSLWLAIPAGPAASTFLMPIADALGAAPRAPDFADTPLAQIARDLDRLLGARLCARLAYKGGEHELLVPPRLLRDVTGDTLLARLLHRAPITEYDVAPPCTPAPPPPGIRPALGPPPITGPAPPARTHTSPLPERGPAVGRVEPFQPATLRLGVSTRGPERFIVRERRDEHGWPAYEIVRPYVDESLAAIPELSIRVRAYDRMESAPFGDHLPLLGQLGLDPATTISAIAPRLSLLRVLRELAVAIARLHAGGEVHGDLKPANVLLLASGVRLFDGLGLAPGQRSPAMTRGWAAPEQLLGLPVSPATDQVPFALMLLELAGGLLYGEESRVLIPGPGRSLTAHALIRDPWVHFADDAILDPAAREPLRALLERCSRFSGEARHPSMLAVIEALDRLLAGGALRGAIERPIAFGQLAIGRLGEDDAPRVGWLIA